MGAILTRLCAELDLERGEAERLLRIFLSTAEEDLRLLGEAVAQGSAEGLVEPAHSIKGAAANLDFPAAREPAEDLERMGRSGQWELAPARLALLRREIDRIRAETGPG